MLHSYGVEAPEDFILEDISMDSIGAPTPKLRAKVIDWSVRERKPKTDEHWLVKSFGVTIFMGDEYHADQAKSVYEKSSSNHRQLILLDKAGRQHIKDQYVFA